MIKKYSLLKSYFTAILSIVVLFLLLYRISLVNYSLFHTLGEMFSIIIAFNIFAIAWNSRKFLENNYLLLIGVAYLFIGGLDLVHTLTYQGMGVFQEASSSLSTQFWLSARFLQGLSFLIAPFLFKRKFHANFFFAAYSAIFFIIFLSIFSWKIFPETFTNGIGLTPFKINAEYLISFIFLLALFLLNKNQKKFDKPIFKLIELSIITSIFSELALTLFTNPYDFTVTIGLFLKIISFYLIYKAITETGFGKPYHLLFKDLVQSQRRYSSLVEYSPETIAVYAEGIFLYINPAGLKLFGAKNRSEIVGKKTLDFVHSHYRNSIGSYIQKIKSGDKIEPMKEFKIIRLNGEVRDVEAIRSEINYQGKEATQIVIRNVTERKKAEEELIRSNEFNKTLLNTIPLSMDIVDEEGNILFLSKKLEEQFGASAIGKKCWELYKDNKKQCGACPLKKKIKIGQTKNIDCTGLFGGKTFKIIHTGMVFQGKQAMMEIFRDITKQKSIEQIARDARVYAENIIDTVREPLVVLDLNYKIISANWYFYYKFNFLKEKVQNLTFYEIYDKYWDIPELRSALKNLIEKNIPIRDLELGHIFPIIGKRTILINARQLYQVESQSKKILLSLIDITERKRLEIALLESEKKYHGLYDSVKDGFVMTDMEGKILECNKAYLNMLAYTEKEIKSLTDQEITPQKWRKVENDIVKNQILDRGYSDEYEKEYIKKDGALLPVAVKVWLFIGDKNNKPIGMWSIVRDITEQKRYIENLRASEEKYRNIFDNASDAIITIDPKDKITSWNNSAERIFGWKKEEVIGKNFPLLTVPENLRQERNKYVQDAYSGKDIAGVETVRLRKDGTKIDVSLTFSPIIDANKKTIGLSGIIRDITDRKEVDRSKTEFVSVASHELRTPLTSISLSTEMLLEGVAGEINAEQKHYLKEIYQDIRGMAKLIEALLNVSRIELRTLMVEPEPASLRDISETVLQELSPQIKHKNIIIEKNYDEAIPLINIDRNLMRIIMQNLLSNSVKYTPPGGKITCEIKKEKDNALIKVADTGLGIPLDQQAKIFTKMFRARNASSIKSSGIGLGLYIVKSIISRFGGKIWFESVENKGTTFYAAIPLRGIKK